ncbi:hypothetical protein EVAR_16306_1 [Eumeta japonica]|uniref:Uncharacterized protein n=1 Tax=Eumeta variegata TaxID=151549 RepID=A0A4C1VEV7_EUMVA|nr:hypothetical protein EVAR_16306_1 [Eumeta japonica]
MRSLLRWLLAKKKKFIVKLARPPSTWRVYRPIARDKPVYGKKSVCWVRIPNGPAAVQFGCDFAPPSIPMSCDRTYLCNMNSMALANGDALPPLASFTSVKICIPSVVMMYIRYTSSSVDVAKTTPATRVEATSENPCRSRRGHQTEQSPERYHRSKRKLY